MSTELGVYIGRAAGRAHVPATARAIRRRGALVRESEQGELRQLHLSLGAVLSSFPQ